MARCSWARISFFRASPDLRAAASMGPRCAAGIFSHTSLAIMVAPTKGAHFTSHMYRGQGVQAGGFRVEGRFGDGIDVVGLKLL